MSRLPRAGSPLAPPSGGRGLEEQDRDSDNDSDSDSNKDGDIDRAKPSLEIPLPPEPSSARISHMLTNQSEAWLGLKFVIKPS